MKITYLPYVPSRAGQHVRVPELLDGEIGFSLEYKGQYKFQRVGDDLQLLHGEGSIHKNWFGLPLIISKLNDKHHYYMLEIQ